MIIITSKISKKIGGNYLDQKYSKGSVGIPRSKIQQS